MKFLILVVNSIYLRLVKKLEKFLYKKNILLIMIVIMETITIVMIIMIMVITITEIISMILIIITTITEIFMMIMIMVDLDLKMMAMVIGKIK